MKIIRSSLLTLWGDGGQSSRPGGSLMPPDSEAVFWGTPRSGATGKEVKALCDEVIHAVNAKFGIELTPEVEIL